jgi:hypothetical protein
MRDEYLIGEEVSRYSADSRKPKREKKVSKTKRGPRRKLTSERNREPDTIGPGSATRGYVVEPAKFVAGDEPGTVEIERKTYKRKNGKGSAKTRDFKKGGKVRGAGIARKGVRPAKIR